MKKLSLVLMIGGIALISTSCKKECLCTSWYKYAVPHYEYVYDYTWYTYEKEMINQIAVTAYGGESCSDKNTSEPYEREGEWIECR